MRFAFIYAQKASFTIKSLCRVLGVTRGGYYAYASRKPGKRHQRETALRERLVAINAETDGRYGSPRMIKALANEGMHVSKRRVERTMRSMGLCARSTRRFVTTTQSDHSNPIVTNTLGRDFTASRPNERWVTDITYVWTSEGFCYLAVIVDLFSRAVVGWSLDTTLSTTLPLAALRSALERRKPEPGLLHHSDRGVQYTSRDYMRELAARGIEVSMSRKGNCWDNAVAESFFATLKVELVHRRSWASRIELRAAVFEYIEAFYNRKRLHSTLEYKTPTQIETEYYSAQAA